MAKALYVIFVHEVMFTAPLAETDLNYFINGILPTLQPVSDEDYMQGPAVILHTAARFSYIIYQEDVYWCAEWQPGLIVVRFSPDCSMARTVLRSPIPDFGGRQAEEEDLRSYDEDAVNHQYNLVFRAWDAQFDEFLRERRSFQRADARIADVYRAAFVHADELGRQIQARYSDENEISRWTARCKKNLREWAGEGLRVKL